MPRWSETRRGRLKVEVWLPAAAQRFFFKIELIQKLYYDFLKLLCNNLQP